MALTVIYMDPPDGDDQAGEIWLLDDDDRYYVIRIGSGVISCWTGKAVTGMATTPVAEYPSTKPVALAFAEITADPQATLALFLLSREGR